ncbi:MAG: hypothetical protein IPM24_10330 [Bryobacterales bacterium]|nr:hypothetical protein [Bryobacterales bacterium]
MRLTNLCCLIVIAAVTVACGQPKFKITETAGIDREFEPVPVEGQTLFVSVRAGESRTVSAAEAAPQDMLRVERTDPVGSVVENGVFVANLSKRVVREAEEDSGTLRALTYKPFDVTFLRTQNRMHWAPSFQRVGANGYSSIGTWHPVQEFTHTQEAATYVLHRSGHHAAYPEVKMDATYTFYAQAPYFLFESKMEIVAPIEMFWLRNQEMTMDAAFTHVAWPGSPEPRLVGLEERHAILEKEPIPPDTPWVCFLNLDKGYGYGAVNLHYVATKTVNAHTSINDGANNGRYWDRHLISRTPTLLEPGERYEEKVAYVLFRAQRDNPLAEFLGWEKRLRNPLRVERQ